MPTWYVVAQDSQTGPSWWQLGSYSITYKVIMTHKRSLAPIASITYKVVGSGWAGGLLIELWWWVADWFAILGCWVFS